MRITYRTLKALIQRMNDQQLDSDVTVEIGEECFAAELRICGEDHGVLDDGHPVLYTDVKDPGIRRGCTADDVVQLAKDIGL